VAHENGQFPLSALSAIPGGRLSHEAAPAWNDLRAHIIRRGGPAIVPTGPRSSYRDLAGQRQLREEHCAAGNCGGAAVPGTSNHGWGRAVDVPTKDMARWLLRAGPRFRWSHDEGARAGEWWHFTYVGGYVPSVDPEGVLTTTERQWLEELRTARGARKRELRAKIGVQMALIRRLADRTGWTIKHRRKRHDLLRKHFNA